MCKVCGPAKVLSHLKRTWKLRVTYDVAVPVLASGDGRWIIAERGRISCLAASAGGLFVSYHPRSMHLRFLIPWSGWHDDTHDGDGGECPRPIQVLY